MALPILGMLSILFGVLVLVFQGFLRTLIGLYFILAGIVMIFL